MAWINDIKAEPVEYGGRMVVFVPGMLENVADFARMVYTQAVAQQRWVLYLTLTSRETNPLAAARQLATITALTQGSWVHASSAQVNGEDSPDVLRQFTHPGDLVIWPEERWLVPPDLENELGITQQVLPGIHKLHASHTSPWYHSLLFWLSALIILVGFSYLEFLLTVVISGAPLKAVLIFLVTLELGILYQLNRIYR